MDYLHQEFDLGKNEIVEVTLDHPANVQLLDQPNFDLYSKRQPYRYHGGYVTTSPYRLRPPQAGHWHLVIDLGGGPGMVRASARIFTEALAS
jgi:hypothetical protein